MEKNAKEKELFYCWGGREENNYSFEKIDLCTESYFIERKPQEYIREYDFETLPELREELNKMWADESCMKDIMQAVLVAAFKNKPEISHNVVQLDSTILGSGEKMPAYIYNF